MRFAVIAHSSTLTNDALADASVDELMFETMRPEVALEALRTGDVALGRLDVLPTLDGVEDGLWALGALEARGVLVLNDAPALLGTHDKLLTAWLLRRGSISHPKTVHVRPGGPFPAMPPPVVVKPRFGSWGKDVLRCDDEGSLRKNLQAIAGTTWFRRQGALVQELVPPQGYDLRVLVAAGSVVGAIFRIAAPGEWRTNIALGGVRRQVPEIPDDAQALALAAAQATGATLVGVDLLPLEDGWTVLEVNGAVEFTTAYSTSGDVFADVVSELGRLAMETISPVSAVDVAAV